MRQNDTQTRCHDSWTARGVCTGDVPESDHARLQQKLRQIAWARKPRGAAMMLYVSEAQALAQSEAAKQAAARRPIHAGTVNEPRASVRLVLGGPSFRALEQSKILTKWAARCTLDKCSQDEKQRYDFFFELGRIDHGETSILFDIQWRIAFASLLSLCSAAALAPLGRSGRA